MSPGVFHRTPERSRGWIVPAAAISLIAMSIAACAKPRPAAPRQVIGGSFRGQTDDGQPVEVTFTEDERAFRGQGTIGGQAIVVAGAVGWRGVASLARADGGAERVELTLSADGETVLLARDGQSPVMLERGGSGSPPAPGGPFSGSFRAEKDGAPLAQVTLVQSGALLAGVGVVAGDPAGITGRSTAPRTAEGLVTFQDGSQVRFQAALAADGDSLTVRGFGSPISMRRGRPR